jgi:transposase-like protein/IS1 family transposase
VVKLGEKLEKIGIHRHDVRMQSNTAEPMDASKQFCPNEACSARGKIGEGTIAIHSYHPQRYRCRICKKTFSARRGTMMEGLRTAPELVVIVVILLAYGCPRQAIVHAYGLDERTVADWQQRAGKHCQQVHQALVEQGKVETHHIQADEIRVKGRQMVAWMGLALDATSRLWMAGAVSIHRDRELADRLLQQVRACCQGVRALLVCTDGWSAYPHSIVRVFREKVKKKAGPGRACLEVWPNLCIATVIKHTKKKRVVEITRKISWGAMDTAQQLLQMTRGCKEFNTALIERFNGTMRERLAALTRKCRHAAQRLGTLETGMYVIGSTYNFCWAHQELSNRKHFGYSCTPAMAAGLTDHIWSISELLHFKVAPAPWIQPKRRGRPRTATDPAPTVPKRPRGRPRKHPLPDPTLPKRSRGRPRQVA